MAVALLHNYVGIQHNLYWSTGWFDGITHLAGGFWAALFACWLLVSCGIKRTPRRVLLAVLSLGVLWELFELFFGLTQLPADSVDTVKDLIIDLGGGVAGYYFARRTL